MWQCRCKIWHYGIKYLVFLTAINSLSYEILTEGRVDLLDVLIIIAKVLGGSGLCYVLYMCTKLVTVNLVCKHPELTDDKVKYITRMIAKDKTLF